MTERMRDMVERHGEAVTQKTAGKILNRSHSSITAMLADGRLRKCCGRMVDVRSIAEYLDAPVEKNELARVERKRQKNNVKSRWSV